LGAATKQKSRGCRIVPHVTTGARGFRNAVGVV
jgi:hypothetical protein